MDPVSKRLQSELMDMMISPEDGISAFPSEDSIRNWTATISGPKDTVYEGLTYRLTLNFHNDYPFKAPEVEFSSKIYHPNVDTRGRICLDILKEKWSPSYTVKSLLISIRSLLGEPNNLSPLNGEAASLWANQEAFKAKMLAFQAQ